MRLTIPPDQYIALKYGSSKSGFVEFEIAADHPVRTYIVKPRGLALFADGSKTFKYYGGYPDPRKLQRQRVELPFSGPWCLIISNPDKLNSAEVDYEIYY